MRSHLPAVGTTLCRCFPLVPARKPTLHSHYFAQFVRAFYAKFYIRYVVQVAHLPYSVRNSFKFSIAPYSGLVLKDEEAVSGDLLQRPGSRVRTYLYHNRDSSKPISVTNRGSDVTELFFYFPLLAAGLRDSGQGLLSVRASEAQKGIWIVQVTDQQHNAQKLSFPPRLLSISVASRSFNVN